MKTIKQTGNENWKEIFKFITTAKNYESHALSPDEKLTINGKTFNKGDVIKKKNKMLLLLVCLVCQLFVFLPSYAQETGDLRYNGRIEIYINEIRDVEFTDIFNADSNIVGYTINEIKTTGWFGIDSLYEADGYYYDIYMGSVNIGYIIEQREIFKLLMQEHEGKKYK